MTLKDYLQQKKQIVETALSSFSETPITEKHADTLKPIYEAMRYSLLAGGKRLRPILTIAAFEAVSQSNIENDKRQDIVLRVATALEMIHTYSLIHDDLPAMDNDDLRRGRPTNHKVYGEALAILAGDSLLTEAFHVVAQAKTQDSEVLLQVLADIALASGAQGMAGGQAIDLASEGKKIDVTELEQLHRLKTGCLIRVAVTSGAKLAGATQTQVLALARYAEAIGLAFQIADDILDVEGGSEEMGKPTGGDAMKDKATYPSIIGLEKARQRATNLIETALQSLTIFGPEADPLREMAQYIVQRKS